MAGKGLPGIGTELLHPLAQYVLMNVQVPAGLRYRYPAFPDKLDRLDLELSAELPSLRLHETPNPGVHQTGSSSPGRYR